MRKVMNYSFRGQELMWDMDMEVSEIGKRSRPLKDEEGS